MRFSQIEHRIVPNLYEEEFQYHHQRNFNALTWQEFAKKEENLLLRTLRDRCFPAVLYNICRYFIIAGAPTPAKEYLKTQSRRF